MTFVILLVLIVINIYSKLNIYNPFNISLYYCLKLTRREREIGYTYIVYIISNVS